MKKILVSGAAGQLGSELMRLAGDFKFEAHPSDIQQMDITRQRCVKSTLNSLRPDLAINASAYTQVDKAEEEPDKAFAVNSQGAENLARCCAELNIPLVHLSTDFVFAGTRHSPYRENDPVQPLSVYGQSKADGELAVQRHLKEHIIVRTSWLYGVKGANFVKTILRLAREKEVLRVVADQFGSPTSAVDLAEALWVIARRVCDGSSMPAWGIYHYCGQGETSWYGLAAKTLEFARPMQTLRARHVEPIGTADFPLPAKRPAYSVLDCRRIRAQFGIEPKPWQDSLKETIRRLLRQPQ